jgi:hypothetical protein
VQTILGIGAMIIFVLLIKTRKNESEIEVKEVA